MKKILLILVLLVSGIASARADEWITAYEDDDVTVFFFDEIKKTSEGYKVWTKWEYNKPRTISSGKSYVSCTGYDEYNNDFDKSRCYSVVFHDKSGKNVDAYDTSYPTWEYLVPGTRGYAVAKLIESWTTVFMR